jgi:hypothetical protein
MEALILRVRDLIADPAEVAEFSDTTITNALVETRVDHVDEDMQSVGSRNPSNQTVYIHFQAHGVNWLDGATFRDNTGTVIITDDAGVTPRPFNPITGLLFLNPEDTEYPTVIRPLRITGSTYNLKAAGANLLVQRLGKLRYQYNVAVGDLRADRGQQIAHVEAQLRELRRSGGVSSIPMFRKDLR